MIQGVKLNRQNEVEAWCPYTIVLECKLKVLQQLLIQCESVEGEVWECGVYRGGSAYLMRQTTNKVIRLFDSWEGLPKPLAEEDAFHEGQFGDVDFDQLQTFFSQFPHTHLHKGWIPDTFRGLEDSKIAFAHVDVDLYTSYMDALNFIYPRLSKGGVMVFDDYDHPECPGATKAVNEFFANTHCSIQKRPPTSLGAHFIVK